MDGSGEEAAFSLALEEEPQDSGKDLEWPSWAERVTDESTEVQLGVQLGGATCMEGQAGGGTSPESQPSSAGSGVCVLLCGW